MPEPLFLFDRGMPDVDGNTPLLPAMKKARDNEEQREGKKMYYALDLQYYNIVPSLRVRIPGTDVMDIRHTKSQRFVFDNLSLHSKIIFPSASILNLFVI
jgi:ribosomal protein S12 methylthiotransferase accessory factor YcaO